MSTTLDPHPIRDPVHIGPTGFPPWNRTLADSILQWQLEYLRQPDGPAAGEPWQLTTEQLRFVCWWYAIDDHGKFVYRRAVLRRMKGWGKDPTAAALAATEFVGPCRFGGWDAAGMPVAIPHSAAWVQVAAVSMDQTRNTMTLLSPMLSDAAISEYGIDVGKTIIYSRGGGRIEAVTSSPRALEGGRPSFVIKNETQHWLPSNEGLEMARAIARNTAKSRDGAARSLAITNAHDPGEGSDAERDWDAYQAIATGVSRATGYLYDSLEAPAGTQLSDRDSLRAGLIVARGDSVWLDVDRLIEEIYDPSTPASMSRRYYLNQLTASEDAWIAPHEWNACATDDPPDYDSAVTLGFDGSVRDDSTALVACGLDGRLDLLGCWEKPDGPAGEDWQVDREAVDAAVFRAFDERTVVGFYCDPAHWQDYVDRWTREFGERVKVKATMTRPLEWWTNRPRIMVDALARFHDAALENRLSHSGDAVLTRHVLNARRRIGRSGVTISKEHPGSPRKIDAAMAAVLAYEARADAVASGVRAGLQRKSRRLYRF
jgi:phage terminase large subunit-like protein